MGPCSRTSTQNSVVIIKDSKGAVFGGVNSRPWVRNGATGNRECFVFTFIPSLTVFRWSGNTQHFVSVTQNGIGWGGGGDTALWLESDFKSGTSRQSDTYNNSCLASSEKFSVYQVEVWTQEAL
jgi:hypothetical protein